jgi:hypothetical protein
MTESKWDKMLRIEKIAAVMYPDLVPPDVQREMAEIAHREGKRSPLEQKQARDRERGGAKWPAIRGK